MRVLIYGAGVIGQIYAGRLHEAGHEVTVLARGQTLETLARDGIALRRGGTSCLSRVTVTGHVGADSSFDLALVTVRSDQVEEILPALAGLRASSVVMMQNYVLEQAGMGDITGSPGDPGVPRRRRVPQRRWRHRVHRDPAAADHPGPEPGPGQAAEAVFRSAGFAVTTTADMDGWLKTHAVFIAGVGAAISTCGGDAVTLAADLQQREHHDQVRWRAVPRPGQPGRDGHPAAAADVNCTVGAGHIRCPVLGKGNSGER